MDTVMESKGALRGHPAADGHLAAPRADILIVDDNAANLLTLEAVLESLGERIVKANSGREALRRLLEQDFAVILLDVNMPDLDGFETAAMIRRRKRTQHTPIIFVSAINRSDHHAAVGYTLGAVDYIFTPLVPDILRTKVGVFVELYRKTEQIRQQAEALRLFGEREHQRLLRETSDRYDTELRSYAAKLEAEVAQRTAAQEELEQLNAALEQRVAERTEELRVSYARLEQEVEERKRIAEALEVSHARLEISNRELREFASVASHELQEPLRKIQSFGDRLAEKSGAVLGEDGLHYVERMQDAAGRMRLLIDDVLAFSCVTTQAQPFAPVDLNNVVGDVISDLEPRIVQSGARITVDPMGAVEGDRRQLGQLLHNLLSNALKFTAPDAAPDVHVFSRRIAPDEAPPTLEIWVQDRGIGFDERYLGRIFQMFQRLHGRGEYAGTGIGLAICRKIAERHGGTITAHSSPGKGAAFVVTLPVTQDQGNIEL